MMIVKSVNLVDCVQGHQRLRSLFLQASPKYYYDCSVFQLIPPPGKCVLEWVVVHPWVQGGVLPGQQTPEPLPWDFLHAKRVRNVKLFYLKH